jgi:hypothetical protein
MQTGWISDGSETPAAGGFAGFLLGARGEPGPVDPLERARLAVDKPDIQSDPDEVAADLVTRGYRPGLASQLAMQLADTEAELAGERKKIEDARLRMERRASDHAAGRITVFDIMAMEAAEDVSPRGGDAARAGMLERRAESLRAQMRETAELMVPQELRRKDAFEQATARAQSVVAQVAEQRRLDDEAEARARTQMAAERAAFRAARRESRPFAGRSAAAEDAGSVSTRSYSPPPGVSWAQLSDWLSKGWRP